MSDNMPTTPRVRKSVDELITEIDTNINAQVEASLDAFKKDGKTATSSEDMATREYVNSNKIISGGKLSGKNYNIWAATHIISQSFANVITIFIFRLGTEIDEVRLGEISVDILNRLFKNLQLDKENLTSEDKAYLLEFLPKQIPASVLDQALEV